MTAPRPLLEDFGWTLRAVSIAFQQRATHVVQAIPSGPRGYLVLLGVSGSERPSQQQLAQTIGLDKTRMTYLLDDLERAGLIERAADPADRRARITRLTDMGRATLESAHRAIAEVEEQLLGGLEPSAKRALLEGLGRVAAAATQSRN